jgi:hypothetical protein
VFCDDFDEHPLPGPWAILREVGGTLGENPAAFVSPPNSLRTVDSALQAGQPLDTALRTQIPLPSPPGTTVLAFQWQAAAVDPSAGAVTVVAGLDFIDAANNRYTVQFALVEQGGLLSVRLEEQSGFIDGGVSYLSHPLPDAIVLGQWTDVGLVVNRSSAGTASAHVTFNGGTELDTPLAITVSATTLQIDIGSAFESEPSNGWTNLYDNVRLDFQP